jgi:hypothetical protein
MEPWFDETPKPCCIHLRMNSMYYRDDERPGLLHNEEAMGYWCNQTNTASGPDDKAAAHDLCQSGRACFNCHESP